jgi:hypothetical protein
MTNNLDKLNILPINKTAVFYSPLQNKDVLVRTGTIADGSCFFHAILHAYSKDYISMTTEDRIKYVKKLRVSIAKKIDKEKWENLSDGIISKISFEENVNKILSGFYAYIQNDSRECTKSVKNIIRNIIDDNNKNDSEVYRLICDMLPFTDTFEKKILPTAYKQSNKNKISECKQIVIQLSIEFYKKEFKNLLSSSTDKIGKDKVLLYIKKLEKLLEEVLKEAEDLSYVNYINSLQDSNVYVDSFTIQLISDKFNRDIYFIDSSTRMPYMNSSKNNLKKRKSIIIMWIGGCHYEIVGKLTDGNKIIREFQYDDQLVKTLYSYLCNQKVIPKYSRLIPKKEKNKKVVDSEHESETLKEKYKYLMSSDSESVSDSEKLKEKYKYFMSSDSETENIKKEKSSSESSSYSD